ncbi:MAG: DegT/DnrJ/EryC1/StrS family aminotransferase [Gammaproteobacteria bacterium]|jgi:dTDP-4-amino-4,6-dideoxygalactose transaminase|nr:DegT/DnrJ/EryC1/StrS family aminotransferase [Gammaproteobacteria bacterium]
MQVEAIPVNSLGRRVAPMRERLLAALESVLDGGHYVLGPAVEAFEAAFAAYCGVAHCVGVASGSDALELALKAVGVAPGDRVAMAANAAMYGAHAALACGAEPVFVDVAADSTLDPAALERALDDRGPVRAVLATHLYGRLAQVDALAAACRGRGIALVEDCAQAHGARAPDGRRAGAFGDAAAFSFYPTKNLGALGDAGAVVSGDAAVAERVRALRQYGWERKYVSALPGGRNSRLDELQARILHEQLPLLDGWNERRRAIAGRYSRGIRHPDIAVPAPAGEGHVVHLYVVHCGRRDALRAHLAEAGIATDVHYPLPDHRQPCLGGRHAALSLPVTERQARTALSLPCFPELSDAEVERVIDACNRF